MHTRTHTDTPIHTQVLATYRYIKRTLLYHTYPAVLVRRGQVIMTVFSSHREPFSPSVHVSRICLRRPIRGFFKRLQKRPRRRTQHLKTSEHKISGSYLGIMIVLISMASSNVPNLNRIITVGQKKFYIDSTDLPFEDR